MVSMGHSKGEIKTLSSDGRSVNAGENMRLGFLTKRERFTPSGVTEALATDFNRELNSTVFSDLRLVEAAFRLPAGSATFGHSNRWC
jgi:hypothetical protein